MIWFLLAAGIAIDHVPEQSIIVETIEVGANKCGAWKKSLLKGQSIVIHLDAPYGVITMATHEGYDMYIGTMAADSTGWKSVVWYTATRNNGFITIGNSRAIVEIVAQKSIEVIGSALYMGEKVSDGLQCTSLQAGASKIHKIGQINQNDALCYAQTSAPVSLYMSHSNDGTQYALNAKGHTKDIVKKTVNIDMRFEADEIQIVAVTADTTTPAVNFQINLHWSGGKSQYEYSKLTAEDAKQGVGIATSAGVDEFTLMMEEPVYPELEEPQTETPTATPDSEPLTGGQIAIIVVGVVLALAVFGAFVTVTIVIIKRAKKIVAQQVGADQPSSSSSSSSSSNLNDMQNAAAEPAQPAPNGLDA